MKLPSTPLEAREQRGEMRKAGFVEGSRSPVLILPPPALTELGLGGAANKPAPPLTPRPAGTRRCCRNFTPIPPRPPRVMVPPTPRREIPASIAPPDPPLPQVLPQAPLSWRERWAPPSMPWLEEQEVLQEAPQAAGPDSQARLRDRRHASDPVRAVRSRSTHKVQTAAHVLCLVAARSQPAQDWYAQPLARPPLASRADPRRAWMRSTPGTPGQARARQEGHRHGAPRGDYPGAARPTCR